MTREESLKWQYANDRQVEHLINEIYDDFERRTCENCKYYSKGYCRRDALIMFGEDFGCNKFERKTDEN